MKKILIITYNFLPNSPTFGSVARCTHLYKFLKRFECSVDVVSVSGENYGFFGHDDLNMKDLHYVRSDLKRKRQQTINSSGLKSISKAGQIFANLLRFINANLIIPDYSVHSIYSVYCKALKIIDNKDVSTVIISAPPHGLSMVVLFLKMKRPDLTYILEYRDSWNTQPIFKKKNYFSDLISRAIERRILSVTDTLVYVSPVVPKLIEDELGINIQQKSALIMNGFTRPAELFYRERQKRADNLRLGYFGVINDFQHSYRSVEFIDRLFAGSKIKVEIDLYGHIEFERYDIEASPILNYKGAIDHERVFDLTQEYDFLIILHTELSSSFEPIPGKFFDYLQARRPILCIMSPRAYIAEFIYKNSLGLVIDPDHVDSCDLSAELESFNFNDKFDIADYSREAQFENYLPLLK